MIAHKIELLLKPLQWWLLIGVIVLSFVFLVPTTTKMLCGNVGNLAVIREHLVKNNNFSKSCAVPNTYFAAHRALLQQKYERATQIFQTADETHRLLANWFLIQTYENQGDYRTALAQIDLTTSTKRIRYATILTSFADQMDPVEFQRYLAQIEQVPEALLVYARYLLSNNQFAEAGIQAQKIKRGEYAVPAQIIMGRSYLYQHQFNEATAIFQQLYDKSPSAEILFWYGKVLFADGKQDLGLQLMLQATKVENDTIPIRYVAEVAYAFSLIGNCLQADELIQTILRTTDHSANSEIEPTIVAIAVLCKDKRYDLNK